MFFFHFTGFSVCLLNVFSCHGTFGNVSIYTPFT